MDATSAATGAVALATCFFYVLTKDDYYCMVNTKCVHQVVTAVLRLCLEYGVRSNGDGGKDVDRAIKEFVRKEKEKYERETSNKKKSATWFAKKGHHFIRKSYTALDTTNLLEIIPKITEIRPDEKDPHLSSLWISLREIKNIRNDVMHVDNNATYSEDTVNTISEVVNRAIEQLGVPFNVECTELAAIKERFQIKLQEIKDSRLTNDEKIMCAIKQMVIKENHGKWAEMILQSMKYENMPLGYRRVPLREIFHETTFEEILDKFYPGSHQKFKSFVFTEILCKENIGNVDIIEGDAGSGKSTFLKMLCLEFCDKNCNSVFKSIRSYSVMILINCRDNDNICSFWQHFETVFEETARIFPEKYVISTLRTLKMIIAIDGLDEGNESSNALVRDVMRKFVGSETVRFLITSRPGFSQYLVEQLGKRATQHRLLNISPIANPAEQEKFISRFIAQMPEVNSDDVIKTFRSSQAQLQAHFRHPLGLILFITLVDLFPEKIRKLSHELSLMQLAFEMHLQNMNKRMRACMPTNSSEWTRYIMNIIGRNCLQWIQNGIFEIDHVNFDKLKDECFLEVRRNDTEMPLENIISGIFLEKKCPRTTIGVIRNFYHRSQQEYFASKVLTGKLTKTRSGSLLTVLRELTREHVEEQDLVRSVC